MLLFPVEMPMEQVVLGRCQLHRKLLLAVMVGAEATVYGITLCSKTALSSPSSSPMLQPLTQLP